MPSNKEQLFQNHVCDFLRNHHGYKLLDEKIDQEYHIIEKDLLAFIKKTQPEKYSYLVKNFGSDADGEIIKALKEKVHSKELWLIMREGLNVKGTEFKLYIQKPRSTTSKELAELYKENIYRYKDEYRYNRNTQEEIDIVIWLNGLPIIVLELKHEDEGQHVDDAIEESFLQRDLTNNIYKLPFLYVALSNTEAKVATNPNAEERFLWFNAALTNKAETEGEYPVEHVYRHTLAPDNVADYLEHYLVHVPAKEKHVDGEIQVTPSFTIFPRFHQFRSSKNLAADVLQHREDTLSLGKKYLINHSAGSGKTLTIAWMADLLDSLYTADNQKLFDNIIILTDRKSLDKNVKDDLEKFTHLGTKINFARRSKDLAEHLEKDRDIIVTTVHKFSYIQEKLQNEDALKSRKIAFLLDEAHRGQDGKLALTMRNYFEEDATEEDEQQDEKAIEDLNISNQVFVAFTATTTPKTVSYFGEPFDVYSEEEAIVEGFILDVAQNIVSYNTLYNLHLTEAIPEKDFPTGTVSKALKNIAYEDDEIIQYKSEVIVKMFEERVLPSASGMGKCMVVSSSRIAGLKYFNTIKTILEEKESPYKVLYAFSDFTNKETKESIEEDKLNNLKGKILEDVFDGDEYRILIVANKFQEGFNQPLLTTMFLDKTVKNENAIQTVSRLNRNTEGKEQDDILVVDFTNNAQNIFDAFNKHRTGSPYKCVEPKAEILHEIYQKIADYAVFTDEEVELYINAYLDAELEARKNNSTPDALLSNLNQDYRAIFKKKLPDPKIQKLYVGLLRRYTKMFFFLAKFFKFDSKYKDFVVFSSVMSDTLIKKGKTSEMKKFLKKVELKKGGVKYLGTKTNLKVVKEPRKTGYRTSKGGTEIPRTTIEEAIAEILNKFPITDEDAIVIKEICEEVSKETESKERIKANKDNLVYLKNNAEPSVRQEVKDGYIKRDLWDKLDDPLYIQKGGIITLMGKSVIRTILSDVG